jgi:16S rRNA processing protein RimM
MSPSETQKTATLKSSKGSPTPGEPLYIPVGKFGRPFSYHGAVIFFPEADYLPGIKPGKILHFPSKNTNVKILQSRPHGKGLLLTLEGSTSEHEAGRLTNQVAFMPAEDLPFPERKGYHRIQLAGMEVFDEKGIRLGIVEEVLRTGANDVYVVLTENDDEILLPAIDSVILKVDLGGNRMTVHPPEWE